MSQYQKVKTNLYLLKQETVSGSGIGWTICKSALRSGQITTPAPHHSVFLQAGCHFCCPTNSIKALKAHGLKEVWSTNIKKNTFIHIYFILLNWPPFVENLKQNGLSPAQKNLQTTGATFFTGEIHFLTSKQSECTDFYHKFHL